MSNDDSEPPPPNDEAAERQRMLHEQARAFALGLAASPPDNMNGGMLQDETSPPQPRVLWRDADQDASSSQASSPPTQAPSAPSPPAFSTPPSTDPEHSTASSPSSGATTASSEGSPTAQPTSQNTSQGEASTDRGNNQPAKLKTLADVPAGRYKNTKEAREADVQNANKNNPMAQTHYINVGSSESRTNYSPVVDVEAPDFEPRQPVYGWPRNTSRFEVSEETGYSPAELGQKWFPDELFEDWLEHTNAYIDMRDEEGQLNNSPFRGERKHVELHEIIYFMVVTLYMGICRLPNKRAYWSKDQYMPLHPLIAETGLSLHRYEYLWRNIHLTAKKEDGLDRVEEAEAEEGSEEDDVDVDAFSEEQHRSNKGHDFDIRSQFRSMAHTNAQGEDDEEAPDGTSLDDDEDSISTDSDDDSGPEPNQEQDSPEPTDKPKWYHKVSPLMEHVRSTSLFFVVVLGMCLAIDEMMIRFSGHSNEMHRMKNKPIGEGYKFYVLACSMTGYVLFFTPDGRVGLNEFEDTKKEAGKIARMMSSVTKMLDEYVSRGLKFVITADNYFIYPKILKAFRDRGIGMFGTARAKRNWPPAELKEEKLSGLFNHLYYSVDAFNNICCRWLDNSYVLMSSTVHRCVANVERKRRRPRENAKNKGHLEKVFGTHGFANIFIPRIINQYNFWMGAVDRTDQMIA